MSIRNLERLFQPQSIALIGASTRPNSVGAVVLRNLIDSGFKGHVMMVNPHHKSVAGIRCFPNTRALPEVPDLAIIATPPSTVPSVIGELAAAGTKAAVVLTAGFGEDKGGNGQALQQAILDEARPHLLRIVGPNCLGILNPHIGLNASFAPLTPASGSLAFVAQSGAVIASVIDWAAPRGIGFSHLVSLGDMADVDFGDMLDYLAQDRDTHAILLYVETITHARKFMSAARAAARIKPVIVVKAGRHAEGAKAAASHTGAMAGADMVYDAAFHRAGMLRVTSLADLFAAVQTLSSGLPIAGDRLAILTNGGGMGVLATDRLIDLGGRLATLSPATVSRLDSVLPPLWSHDNPVDIIGDADPARYRAALEALLSDRAIDAILVLNCPTAVASSRDAATAVAVLAKDSRVPLLTSWIGGAAAAEGRAVLNEARLPTYDTPEEAVQAFMHMVQYHRNQRALMETPSSAPQTDRPDRTRVRSIIDTAVKEGREWLSLPEALAVLSAYGIPTVETWFAPDMAALKQLAATQPQPLAIKIESPDVQHKSEVGGVALDLEGPLEVAAAAGQMADSLRRLRPQARLGGFVLQRMVHRPHAHELILGIAEDRQFGPVVLFGHGGTASEVIADRAIGLPPLNGPLARDLMHQTKVFKLLEGYRDRPRASMDDVELALIRLSQLAADHPEIAELDINPLLADENGVLALDGRIRLGSGDHSRLAILPYPRELETRVDIPRSGLPVVICPVRPDDAASLRDMLLRCKPEDLYLRFFKGLHQVPNLLAARLTQIDYEREMAFAAFSAKPSLDQTVADTGLTHDGILGIIHLAATPDLDSAEFAIIVRSDIKGKGLGYFLMQHMIAYAKGRGIGRVYGHVLRGNGAMLTMSRELGFVASTEVEDERLIQVSLDLDRLAAIENVKSL